MKLEDALHGVSSLAFDTAPIIYFVEANPAYDKLVANIFNPVAAGELEGWTSVIMLGRRVAAQEAGPAGRSRERLPNRR
jgi:hypothetical protein